MRDTPHLDDSYRPFLTVPRMVIAVLGQAFRQEAQELGDRHDRNPLFS